MGFKKEGKPKFSRAKAFTPKTGGFERRAPKFELFDVTCDKCGKDTQVPFKPSSGKPIFCRDCFGKNDGPKKRSDASGLDEINEKLDKIMRALRIN
jgi:CxxC-x17-CxxC domain-containing protein